MSAREPNTKMLRLRVDEMKIHPTAKRQMVVSKKDKMKGDMDLDGTGVFHVVRYRISAVLAYWLIDGYHRQQALTELDMGEWVVDVQFHMDVKTDARASALFRVLNTTSAVAPYDRFLNAVSEGIPLYVRTNDLVGDHGLSISRHSGDGSVRCVMALVGAYKKDSGESLSKALGVILAAWGDTSAGLESHIISGLSSVFAKYNSEVDESALTKKLAKYRGGAPNLLGAARSIADIQGGSVANGVHSAIVFLYNKGRRSGQLEA